MSDYRAYLMGHDGHIVERFDLVCMDEGLARDKAEKLALQCDVELWQLARRIEVYPRRSVRLSDIE